MLCFLCIPCAASQQHKWMRFIAHQLPSGGTHKCTEITGNCGARTPRLDIVTEDDSIPTSEIVKWRRAYSLDSFRRYACRTMEESHAFEISPNEKFRFYDFGSANTVQERENGQKAMVCNQSRPIPCRLRRITGLKDGWSVCKLRSRAIPALCRWHSRRSARECVCFAPNVNECEIIPLGRASSTISTLIVVRVCVRQCTAFFPHLFLNQRARK